MSVYIPGMEMPTEGGTIVVYKISGNYFAARAGKDELFHIVPVPEHGRLIDADALEYEEAYLNGHYELGDVEIVTRKDIESAPTIIPADKEGEG